MEEGVGVAHEEGVGVALVEEDAVEEEDLSAATSATVAWAAPGPAGASVSGSAIFPSIDERAVFVVPSIPSWSTDPEPAGDSFVCREIRLRPGRLSSSQLASIRDCHSPVPAWRGRGRRRVLTRAVGNLHLPSCQLLSVYAKRQRKFVRCGWCGRPSVRLVQDLGQ